MDTSKQPTYLVNVGSSRGNLDIFVNGELVAEAWTIGEYEETIVLGEPPVEVYARLNGKQGGCYWTYLPEAGGESDPMKTVCVGGSVVLVAAIVLVIAITGFVFARSAGRKP